MEKNKIKENININQMLELISINFMFVAINSLVANGSKFWFSDGSPTLSNEFFTRISDYVNYGWN